jgi:CDP-4-dehydro-6-deoxyglucose reductase
MTYEVQLKPSGRSFNVEAGQPILVAGLAAGIKMPYGCRIGTCRSCKGRILTGTVDFGDAHPAYLTKHQRDEGYALLCRATARADLVIELEELPLLADPQIVPAIVKRIKRAAPDVAIVSLRLPLHLNLRFEAGQYVDLLLANGVRRSYSIANAPNAAGVIDLEFHVRHLPGGLFTDHVFSSLRERDKLQLEAPLGTFLLRESEKPALFVASGTGYAPIRSILLNEFAKSSSRRLVLYWGGRTLKDLYMIDEPRAFARNHANFSFVPVLSEALEEDRWEAASGFVHSAVMADFPDLAGWQVYACGAPLMVEAAREDFSARCGLPETEFFADAFLSRADVARLSETS